jgi:hypothetical protein
MSTASGMLRSGRRRRLSPLTCRWPRSRARKAGAA